MAAAHGCIEAERRRAGSGEARWRAASAALIAFAAGCSDAGGGADPTPFPAAGTGGTGAPIASGGSGGGQTIAAAGSGGAPDDGNLVNVPGDFVDPEDTQELPPEPVSAFPEAPSCEGGEPEACNEQSCCMREIVSTLEPMTVAPNTTVTLSLFALDKFEVTVERFRTFLESYDDWRDAGHPSTNAGEHPFTPGSGWVKDPTWEVALPDSAAVMRVGLNCNPSQQTWTDQPAFNELKPINCVSWYEAFAFCVWDEGRLPTEAEWQYAAVGGAQARSYAWGNTELASNFASYACEVAGTSQSCTVDDIPDVGSRPDGDGRFGHSDLTGSLYEWTLDWYAAYPELMRDDYAKTDTGTQRVLRGGAWNSTTTQAMSPTDRSNRQAPTFRSPAAGFRCARQVDEGPQ